MTLMNSDFLRDRRNGLRININESEIADAAKTSKNKAKAAMAYILEKGYLHSMLIALLLQLVELHFTVTELKI